MMRKGQVVISFLSFLLGSDTRSLSAAFQQNAKQNFPHTKHHDISPMIPMSLKSYHHAPSLFGRTVRSASSSSSSSSSSKLQNSYLDTLSPDSSSSTPSTKPNTSNDKKRAIDYSSISKYTLAGVTQLALFSASFFTLDKLLARFSTRSVLPSPITWLLFYAISMKSRIFNPLNNRRPDPKMKASPGFNDRIMPKWTPPGVVFPIVWLIFIPTLRATSSTIIVNTLGRYCDVTVMALILHLTFGDVWNTINNTERRYGTSVLANVFTYLGAVYASLSYGIVNPTAGRLLGLTLVWLSVASCLITQTWRLNRDGEGRKEPLLPRRLEGEDSPTRFWFQ